MRSLPLVAVILVVCSLIPTAPVPSLGPNRPPAAPVIEGASAVSATLGVNISFTANTSDPEVYDALYWSWIWGDGTTSSSTGNATVPVSTYGHIWTALGKFFVNVTVSDGFSGPIQCPSPVAVTVVPPSPGTLKGVVGAANGTPLADATVYANPGGHTAKTDASGGYALSLDSGTYSVAASAPGFVTATQTGRRLNSGAVTIADFSLSPLPGNVTGTVTGNTGIPIADARVVIAAANGSNQIAVYTLTTDNHGRFTQSVPGGTYIVTAAAPGYKEQNRSGVYVAPGQNVSIDFALVPEAAPAAPLSLQALIAVGGVVVVAIAVVLLLRRRRKPT